MRIVSLCPTYRRRRLLQNALACFKHQTHEDKHLLIGDDSGEYRPVTVDNWTMLAMEPQKTLPGKYNAMAKVAFSEFGADAVAVFEDDDVYFDRYLAYHSKMETWSHCSWVWTDSSGGGPRTDLRPEKTGHGRLHGCLAMTKDAYNTIGGWPDTARMDFDFQVLSALNKVTSPYDPCIIGPSQYYFRWVSTDEPHGQGFSSGPDDDDWLSKAQKEVNDRYGPVHELSEIYPQFDNETQGLLTMFSGVQSR